MKRAGRVLAFVLCLVGVGLVGMVASGVQMVTRWYEGAPDQTISSPDYDLRVTDVVLAREVVLDEEALSTPGVWVVVEWEVDVKRQSASFDPVLLTTAEGTAYEQRSEVAGAVGVPRTDPGFTGMGTSVFQLPPDALEGADFTVERSQGFLFTHGAGVRVPDVVPADAPVLDSYVLGAPVVQVTR